MAQVEAEVGQAPTMTGAQLAESIVSNLTQSGTFSTAEEDQRVGRLALTNLTRDKVNAEFARAWAHAGQQLLTLTTPQPQEDAQVMTWLAPGRGRAGPRPPAGAPGPALGLRQLRRGRARWSPTSRSPTPAFHRIAFANGLRLNFKSSLNAQDRVEIRIRFGAGQEELRLRDVGVARLGCLPKLLREGGLGKNDFEDTVRFCEGHACGFELAVGRDAFELGAATRPSDLDAELQLIAAYLSDPGFRPEVDARQLPTAVHTLYDMTRSEPGFAAAQARDGVLPPPRVPLLPPEKRSSTACAAPTLPACWARSSRPTPWK